MTDIEDLRNRRDRLLLERDVSRLERQKRYANVVRRWSWWWVLPLAAFGAWFVLAFIIYFGVQTTSDEVGYLSMAIIGLAPLFAKLKFHSSI